MVKDKRQLGALTLVLLSTLALIIVANVSTQSHGVTARFVSGSTLDCRTGARLGLKYTLETNGTTVATGTANVTQLNAWSNQSDTSYGWVNDRLPLSIQGRVAMGGSSGWTLPIIDGPAILTPNGKGIWRAEPEYTVTNSNSSTKQAGMNAGFVWVDQNHLTGSMIVHPGYGLEVPGVLRLEGNSNAVSNAALVADTSHWKAVGLEVKSDTTGYGAGKLHIGALDAMFFQKAVVFTQTTTNNGDESEIGIFTSMYNTVAYESNNKDNIGQRVGYATQLHTPTMFKYNAGGDLHVGYLLGESSESLYGVVIAGNDSSGGSIFNSGTFCINHVGIDGGVNSAYQAIRVDPASGSNPCSTDIHFLHNATNRTSNPLIYLKNSYGHHRIRGGEYLHGSGIIHVEGGSSTFFPTVIVECCMFQNGADLNNIRNLFDAASRDYVQVIFVNCWENHGGTGQVNHGYVYDPAGNGSHSYVHLINITTNSAFDIIN